MRPLFASIVCIIASFAARFSAAQTIGHDGCTVDAEVLKLPECAVDRQGGETTLRAEFLPILPHFSDSKSKLAYRELSEGGWAYFNRQGRVLVKNVASFDNGSSPFHYGLVRITQANKWGLADVHGTIVVPLEFDGAYEYEPRARHWTVCKKCHLVEKGEYSWFEGGTWFALDKHGKLIDQIAEPTYPR